MTLCNIFFFIFNFGQHSIIFLLSDSVTKKTLTATNSLQTPSKEPISREPSFMYDTTVEAFGAMGTNVDEMNKESDDTDDIFTIGEIIDFPETTENEQILKFIELNTPPEAINVKKFEYSKDETAIATESINIKDLNEQEKLAGSLELNNLKIPLSSSPLRVENLFLTETMQEDQGVLVPFPRDDLRNRRLSNISIEEEKKISSTPEGENYFMKREESFIAKVDKGEIENLAIEISDYYNAQPANVEALCVKPVKTKPEAEIEVSDFGSKTNLTVKPLEDNGRKINLSSYEQIYDSVSIETMNAEIEMSTKELMSNLGDRFLGTQELPDCVSSFEDFYQRSAEGLADQIVTSALKETSGLPLERWSAPAGAVEPPILDAEEFSNRFDPLMGQIEHHWDEIENMVSTQTLTGEG